MPAIITHDLFAKDIYGTAFESIVGTRYEAEAFLRSCVGAVFTVAKAEEKPTKRYPAAPFTTSTLQQEAGRKLGMSVGRFAMPSASSPQAMAAEVTTTTSHPAARTAASCRARLSKNP